VPGLEEEIRRGLSEIDSRLIVRLFMPMAEQVAGNFNLDRLVARLTLTFGGVALLLACLGIYGVTAHAVARRTREIGIRMALGGAPRDVLRLVVGQGMRLAVVGLGLGIAAALASTRLMNKLLFGIRPNDPVTFVTITLLLVGVALVATWIPARRAIRTDPTTALRTE
jgi:ABC-type antimicrobial peptide transport system permease subunit